MTWPRAILLDCYGTLVDDDEALLVQVCVEVAKAAVGEVTPQQVGDYWNTRFNTLCSEHCGSRFLPQKEITCISLAETVSHFQAVLDMNYWCGRMFDRWQQPVIYPESHAVLRQCPVPVCVVSNADNTELLSAFAHHGLTFDYIVSSEDARSYKPKQEIFRQALALLSLSPKDVLHVGDSLWGDVHGAKALDIPVLWLNRRGRTLPDGHIQPDYSALDLTGVLDLLKSDDLVIR